MVTKPPFLDMLGLAKFRNGAALLIFLVLMLFFFPVHVGSFQATHGPTTTVKESSIEVMLQALVALLIALVLSLIAPSFCFGFADLSPLFDIRPAGIRIFSLRC